MTEQANVFLKRLRYTKNAMKNSLIFLKANFNQEIYPQLYTPEIFYEACRNLQSFYDHQETSQNAKYSAIDKKKSHLNQEIKKLIKKNIFPELYNEQCNKIPSSSIDDNQGIMWQNFKTSNIAYSQLCKKLSLFKSIPSRLIKKISLLLN